MKSAILAEKLAAAISEKSPTWYNNLSQETVMNPSTVVVSSKTEKFEEVVPIIEEKKMEIVNVDAPIVLEKVTKKKFVDETPVIVEITNRTMFEMLDKKLRRVLAGSIVSLMHENEEIIIPAVDNYSSEIILKVFGSREEYPLTASIEKMITDFELGFVFHYQVAPQWDIYFNVTQNEDMQKRLIVTVAKTTRVVKPSESQRKKWAKVK